MSTITQDLSNVNRQINHAANQASRPPAEIQLLAVSKTKPLSAIQEAYQCGQRAFGENYVQEGVDKIQLSQQQDWLIEPIEWHFIGPLQSNKTKLVAENFTWIQSIDRIKIAERLNHQRPKHLAPLNVCIQVNISEEDSKSGVTPEEALSLAQEISIMPQLKLRGLMAIPQKSNDIQTVSANFKKMQDLFIALKQRYSTVDTLSMGMSADLEPAIQQGSTMVRIGSAIFGNRN